MSDKTDLLLGAVIVLVVVCAIYVGQISVTLGKNNLSQVMEENRQLQAQLDAANETIAAKEKAIDDFVGSPVYPLYMSWVEGNQRVGEVIVQAQWLVDNGQAAIDTAYKAKQAYDTVNNVKQTLKI